MVQYVSKYLNLSSGEFNCALLKKFYSAQLSSWAK